MESVLAFDLGDTLLTYEGVPPSWKDHYAEALARGLAVVGREVPSAVLGEACARLARYNTRLTPRQEELSADRIFAEVLEGLCPARDQDTVLRGFFAYFRRSCRAYPESRSFLEALRRQGRRVAVLTDVAYGMPKDLVEGDLKVAGLDDLVDVLLSSVEVGRRKPHPEGFRRLAAALGVESRDLAYVGNESRDMEGIRAAGGSGILVDREGLNPDWGQARTVRGLDELL